MASSYGSAIFGCSSTNIWMLIANWLLWFYIHIITFFIPPTMAKFYYIFWFLFVKRDVFLIDLSIGPDLLTLKFSLNVTQSQNSGKIKIFLLVFILESNEIFLSMDCRQILKLLLLSSFFHSSSFTLISKLKFSIMFWPNSKAFQHSVALFHFPKFSELSQSPVFKEREGKIAPKLCWKKLYEILVKHRKFSKQLWKFSHLLSIRTKIFEIWRLNPFNSSLRFKFDAVRCLWNCPTCCYTVDPNACV